MFRSRFAALTIIALAGASGAAAQTRSDIFEGQTISLVVGFAPGNVPLTIRGSVYMDYSEVYLQDPQGRPDSTGLWGTGIGFVASYGSHWEARFLFSEPLLKTATTSAYSPFFNFSLTGQF